MNRADEWNLIIEFGILVLLAVDVYLTYKVLQK